MCVCVCVLTIQTVVYCVFFTKARKRIKKQKTKTPFLANARIRETRKKVALPAPMTVLMYLAYFGEAVPLRYGAEEEGLLPVLGPVEGHVKETVDPAATFLPVP